MQDTNNEGGCQGIRRVSAKIRHSTGAVAEALDDLEGNKEFSPSSSQKYIPGSSES